MLSNFLVHFSLENVLTAVDVINSFICSEYSFFRVRVLDYFCYFLEYSYLVM